MTITANRGKVAETLVKKRLEQLSKASNFAAYRPPDARAGYRNPTLADFMYIRDGRLKLLEVKETQHSFRLAHGNFGADQVARMRLWQAAGAHANVLIYHSLDKVWRCINVDHFVTREGGSWDLRPFPTTNLESAVC